MNDKLQTAVKIGDIINNGEYDFLVTGIPIYNAVVARWMAEGIQWNAATNNWHWRRCVFMWQTAFPPVHG